MRQLSTELLAFGANLQSSLITASTNVEQLSSTLNGAATTDSKKVGSLLDQFHSTAVSLNHSMDGARESARPTRGSRRTSLRPRRTSPIRRRRSPQLTKDLRTVTGNPQTQAQLRNTIANLDAVMQKANSLLGELGGTSSVYGVDAGATPAPCRTAEQSRRIRTFCRRRRDDPGTGISPAAARASARSSSTRWPAISSRFKCD